MSEADPFRKGVVKYLGRTVNDLCPVGVIAAYLAVQGRHPGPFFKVVIGAFPSRVALVSSMRAA